MLHTNTRIGYQRSAHEITGDQPWGNAGMPVRWPGDQRDAEDITYGHDVRHFWSCTLLTSKFVNLVLWIHITISCSSLSFAMAASTEDAWGRAKLEASSSRRVTLCRFPCTPCRIWKRTFLIQKSSTLKGEVDNHTTYSHNNLAF